MMDHLQIILLTVIMTSKGRNLASNLFTLNESKVDDNIKSDQESFFDQVSDIDLNDNADEANREQIEKLTQQLQMLKKQVPQLKLKNKQLKDLLDIADLHNAKHQQKQRQLIKKLSHEQISNKQLQFEVKKASEQILRIRQSSRFSDSRNVEASNSLKKAQEQRTIFIHSFKKIAEAIAKCERVEDFQICVNKFLDFIRKNIRIYQTSQKNSQYELQLKFQLSQLSSLKSKNSELEVKLSKAKQQLQKQRVDKKRIISTFNDKISKLKQQSDELRSRIEQRDNEAEFEINTLKKTINEKNQIIYELKYKIDSEKKRKDSVPSKKSRVRKRSYYISDGEKQQGDFKMSELENEIQNLERQLIQELKE